MLGLLKTFYGRLVERFRLGEGRVGEGFSPGRGICQGCPISPFLFIIVMTVLIENAYTLLSPAARQAVTEQRLYDTLYADDTLILALKS